MDTVSTSNATAERRFVASTPAAGPASGHPLVGAVSFKVMFDQETPDPGRRERLFSDSSATLQRPELQPAAEDLGSESIAEEAVPKTVGPFAIVETLGTGAMGEVYLARDQRLERWVALKRIQPGRHGRESVARFRREARAAAKLHHRSIVQVHDLLETEESDWLVMERLEGESLADRLQRGPLKPLDAVHVAIRIAEGLAAAHDAGVMHRDLKASNIMLTPNGVKILDFGLAKSLPGSERQDTGVTSEGQLIGTIASMAPEQAKGLEVDQRADLFAFGMMLYEMLTGASPFKRRSALATMNAICDATAPRLDSRVADLPPVLVQLVHHLLAKDPDARPPGGAHEVAGRLREARAALGGSSSSHQSAVAPGGRDRGRVLLIVLIALALAALLLLLLDWLGHRPPAPERPLRLVVANFDYEGLESHRYFAQGLAEEIRSRLSTLEAIRVVRPPDPESPRSGSVEVPITRQLDIDFVLEGRISWQSVETPVKGSAVSVYLHLRDGNGESRWRGTFTERGDEILELQARLANEVARELPIETSARERDSIQLKGTYNQAAYLAYLEGRDWERRSRFASENIQHALDAYRRAVELDALFVDAHARLIRFLTLDYLNRARSQEREIDIERRLAALDDLAPEHPATLLATAEVEYRVKGEYGEATKNLERVLAIEPGNADALATLAYVSRRQVHFDDAVATLEEVGELIPYDASIPADIADTLRAQRRFIDALRWYRESLRLFPGDGWVRGQAALCLFETQACETGACDLGPALALLDEAPDPDDEAVRLHRFWLAAANAPDGDLEALAAALEHLPAEFTERAYSLPAFPARAAALEALGRREELQELASSFVAQLEEEIRLGDRYPTNYAFLAIGMVIAEPAAFDDARRHAEKAIELSRDDHFSGPRARERWAMALAFAGRSEEAAEELEILLDLSYQRAVTRRALRLDPVWAPLRP